MAGAVASAPPPMPRRPAPAAAPVGRVEQGSRPPARRVSWRLAASRRATSPERPLVSSVPPRRPAGARQRDPIGPTEPARRPADADPALPALMVLPRPRCGSGGGETPPSTPRPRSGKGLPKPAQRAPVQRAPGRRELRPARLRRSMPRPAGPWAVGWRAAGRVSAAWTSADSPAARKERARRPASRGRHRRRSLAGRRAWVAAVLRERRAPRRERPPGAARVEPPQPGVAGPRA